MENPFGEKIYNYSVNIVGCCKIEMNPLVTKFLYFNDEICAFKSVNANLDMLKWRIFQQMNVFSKIDGTNTEHVQGLGANGKAAFSPKAHG